LRILVTGAGGFIGRQVAAALVAAGHQVAPGAYRRCFRLWFALGWPAFLGVIAIFAVMVWKPVLRAT